ncbi:MAG: metal ABC transporter substrate-binding protein, partial [Actinomycetota bacterium]
LAKVVEVGETAFAAADPDHPAFFKENPATTAEVLATLDAEFAQRLATCDFDAFVTTHEAFTYLARAYGLRQVALEGAAPESEPSAAAIEDALAAIADGSAAPAVFAEATEGGRRIGGAVATDAGVPLYGLSTLETDPAPLAYPAVMRANLESLATGLGCR